MTPSHLGCGTCATCGGSHSATAPAPARPPLIAIVGLAAGWKNPAPQTPRASARRPGSGSQGQGLQLARCGARVPARCQRGADVVSWTPRLPSMGGEGLGRLLASHLRGSFWAPSSIRPSYIMLLFSFNSFAGSVGVAAVTTTSPLAPRGPARCRAIQARGMAAIGICDDRDL